MCSVSRLEHFTPGGKEPSVQWNRRLGGVQSSSRRYSRKIDLSPFSGIQTHFPSFSMHSLVTVPTTVQVN